MSEKHVSAEEKKGLVRKKQSETRDQEAQAPGGEKGALTSLQQQVGNQAVQRLLAQRQDEGSGALDDETAGQINSKRGGGQPLDAAVQKQMESATGQDLSGVNVHTDSESDALNKDIGAKAFTTGQDIFFKSGEYDPGSSGGQELLAHELTHVVQQGSGRVQGGGGKMTVNEPGDSFEQEADSVAKSVTSAPAAGAVQQQEEDEIQMQEEEEEMVQPKLENAAVQMQEEEEIQMQEEEEEMVQPKLENAAVQMQEEDEIQMQEEEEEMLQPKLENAAVQLQEEDEIQMQEEEEVQMAEADAEEEDVAA